MKYASIGAFVLSLMLVPLAAMGDDLLIDADTNRCHVLLVDGTDVEEFSGNGLKITVGVKRNGGVTAKCTVDMDPPGENAGDFDSNSGLINPNTMAGYVCTVIAGGMTVSDETAIDDEWQDSINPQGRVLLKCQSGGLDDGELPPGNPNFCANHPFHEKCSTP